MALYLDQQTGPTLKRILEKWIESHPSDFIAPRILDSIESDDKRKQEIADCKHKYSHYSGKKDCCNRCGNYAEGMGFEWEHSHDLDDTQISELAGAVEKPMSPIQENLYGEQ